MSKARYIPSDDEGKLLWINNFAAKLPTHAALVAVTGDELDGVAADRAFFAYVLDAQDQYSKKAQQWTAFKNQARSGTALGALPVPVDLPAPPPFRGDCPPSR